MTEACVKTSSTKAISFVETDLKVLCSSTTWQTQMLQQAPFSNREQINECAENAFDSLNEQDWLEAFQGHPMIGDLNSLKKKYAQGANLSAKEQSGAASASEHVLNELLELNQKYVERFGFIFIVCASGKSALEMLQLLKGRINRSQTQELETASQEQKKITMIRIDNLIATKTQQENRA